MEKLTYTEKLKDPRWQKKRLQVFERDDFQCQFCYAENKTLHVHHLWYMKGEPWEIPNNGLLTLCEDCHRIEYEKRELVEACLIESLRISAWSVEAICGFTIMLKVIGDFGKDGREMLLQVLNCVAANIKELKRVKSFLDRDIPTYKQTKSV